MRIWSEINWPAMNKRAREIEATIWQWSPDLNDFKEEGAVVANVAQANRIAAQALMIWGDDGGRQIN